MNTPPSHLPTKEVPWLASTYKYKTLSRALRDHLKLDMGARLDFVIEDDGRVILRPLTRHVGELAGLLYRPGRRPVSVDEMRRWCRMIDR